VTYVGRFAPSPTGPLHFGSLVAAVASWLDARSQSGRWLVRIEDVDGPRTVPGADREILRSLQAFGLEWDGEVAWQSARTELYEAALRRLRDSGHVYRCRCSRREIADSAVSGIEGPLYPGICRGLGLGLDIDGADRFRAAPGAVAFDDRVMGTVVQDVAAEVGDFVLRRRDGLYAYQLAVVVDDADQGITDVVRGADLLLSTPRQILLQRALGVPTPRYLHLPVAAHASGQKLSKQSHAVPVDPSKPREALARALLFLGQDAGAAVTPEELLANAVSSWRIRTIPRQRAVPVE